MSLFVDTSVWSLALRRAAPSQEPEVGHLLDVLRGGQLIVSAGLVLQELLQGFSGPTSRDAILRRFGAIPLLTPDRRDHVEAAELRNGCRRRGVQIGTVDALLAQLCIRHDLTMLTTDKDFRWLSQHFPLAVWSRPT